MGVMDGVARLQEAAFDGATAAGDRHQAVDLYGLAHDAPRRQQRVLLPVGPLTEHPTPRLARNRAA